MRKLLNVRVVAFCGLTLLAAILLSSTPQAEARMQYMTAFGKKYDGLAAQLKEQKCNTCHVGKKKTDRNDYGNALAKLVGKKNEKDAGKIVGALEKAEKEKNAKGMTFGELIKAGKLPGTAAE